MSWPRMNLARFPYLAIGAAIAAIAFLGPPPAASAQVVNVDATQYGDGLYVLPTVGEVAPQLSLAQGGLFNQLTLAAGTYSVSNATGMAGANPNFTAWRVNGDCCQWSWSFAMADSATNKLIFVADPTLTLAPTQAAAATAPGVQNFFATFTLPTTTKVDFMILDGYLPDNAGGVALNIQPYAATTTPEPGSLALLGTGLAGLVPIARRKRRK